MSGKACWDEHAALVFKGRDETYFITSRSEGSSDEISDVSLSRWRDDISGKGAELSNPRRERMSARISLASWGSLEVCSRSSAGNEFWPT